MLTASPLSSALALALALVCLTPALAAGKPGKAPAAKKAKEISTDDKALDKQMDWETKILGPNTQKKIDLKKIQRLQAEETARREKQERLDQAERDRKEREAASAAAAQRNVKAPSTHDVPSVAEKPLPAKPVEKHDDAFVDKLLSGKAEKKKVVVSNDEVDQLLDKAKKDQGASIVPAHAKGGRTDTVDQLLATADKQAPIKTRKQVDSSRAEPVSAEAAAREAALKAIAATKVQQDERSRSSRPAIPDAAVLRAQAAARAQTRPSSGATSAAPAPAAAPTRGRAEWTDPFAGEDSADRPAPARGQTATAARMLSSQPATSSRSVPSVSGRRGPATRPSAPSDSGSGWQDPFDSGAGPVKLRPAAVPKPAPVKHPPAWKDPFA